MSRPVLTVENGAPARDEWLGRMLLCAHPAVPPACLGPALLVWALGMEEDVVARTFGWTTMRLGATLRRFARRCRALQLSPAIPHGRDFLNRYRRMIGLIEALVDELATSREAAPALEVLSRMTESLVDHPLAGSPDAHALRARVRRTLLGRQGALRPSFQATSA